MKKVTLPPRHRGTARIRANLYRLEADTMMARAIEVLETAGRPAYFAWLRKVAELRDEARIADELADEADRQRAKLLDRVLGRLAS